MDRKRAAAWRRLGIHFRNVCRGDKTLRGWIVGVPCDAYVYDLCWPWYASCIGNSRGFSRSLSDMR